MSGLHRNPIEHMPWLQALGQRQARLKAEAKERRRSVEDLNRQDADLWTARYRSAWHPEHDP